MQAEAHLRSEAARFERLRAQDGKPLLPPPNLQHLTANGGLDPAKVQAATALWQSALAQMQQAPSFPGEETLFWTSFLLARHYAEHTTRDQANALLEQSLPHLRDPRHRQLTIGMLARNKAVLSDHAGAAALLSQLQQDSEDLQIDTNYRFSVAYVALMRDDAQTALQVLGWNVDDVPISDAYDLVCGVLRAHAHERDGRVDVATEQLFRLAPSGSGAQTIAEIARANPSFQLCPQARAAHSQRIQQFAQNTVVTRSGISVGPLVLLPIVGVLVIGGGQALVQSMDLPWGDTLFGVLLAGFIMVSIGLSLRMVLRPSMQRKKLSQNGVRGTGQLLAIQQTGTRVNDQPMIRFQIMVELPDRAPYIAIHNEVVPMIRLPQLVPGSNVPVLVDPTTPTLMAIAWA